MSRTHFRFGPFRLDPEECELTCDGRVVDIQPRAFDLLRYLVERPNKLVSRDDLLRDVWDGVVVSDQALTQMLRKVRKALGDSVDEPVYLATVQKRGYRFIAPVVVDGPAPPDPSPEADAPTTPVLLPSSPRPAAAVVTSAGLDTFLGRGADLTTVLHNLEHGHRLVTLVGPVGVGKSRLAREIAAALGCLTTWINLADTPPADATRQIRTPAPDARLLVLDDADALLDEVVRAIPAWLAGHPQRAALVTSREGLRMEGEQVWPVRPLDSETVDDAGVQLFLARARAVHPGWAPSPADLEDARALVTALDGLPLAIELAASRVRSTSPGLLLERIDDRLNWLVSERRDVPARHQRLSNAIESSWAMLTPAQQATLAQLSGFTGPFAIADAERALDLSAWPDAPSPFAAVDALFGKSLVVRAADAEAPYRLLASVRAFAAKKLATVGAIAVGGASWTGPDRASALQQRVGAG